jgi:nucleoside-diphosphate kinase
MATEYALSLAKPDAFRRGLVGAIITRLENKGLSLVDLTVKYATAAMIEKMYADKNDEPYFPALLEYMLSGPVVAMLWQGEDANKALRLVVGSKDPLQSPPGSLRGDYAGDIVKTLVHGSRNPAEAYSEALIWFPERFGAEPVKDEKAVEEGREIAGLGKTTLPEGNDPIEISWAEPITVIDPAVFRKMDEILESGNLTVLKRFEAELGFVGPSEEP